MAHPIDDLRERAAALGLDVLSREFAQRMDEADELRAFREEFLIPATRASARVRQPGTRSLYFCGNSLGLQPRATRAYVIEELDKWAEYGVEGHMMTSRPWMFVDETVKEGSARLVGAKPLEVVVMNTLTVNLHLMMVAFYRPTATRFKILIEAKAFPSDWVRRAPAGLRRARRARVAPVDHARSRRSAVALLGSTRSNRRSPSTASTRRTPSLPWQARAATTSPCPRMTCCAPSRSTGTL